MARRPLDEVPEGHQFGNVEAAITAQKSREIAVAGDGHEQRPLADAVSRVGHDR
jgi:hypothetical protein